MRTSTLKGNSNNNNVFSQKMESENLAYSQVEVDNIFETMRIKNATFGLATSSSLFSETRWSLLEQEFRTQYSARLNSNGPTPLNSQIQMSAVWGKLVVKFPREGTAEEFKGRIFACPPPPLPIQTLIPALCAIANAQSNIY